eukprot:TRINITY_DN514_c0_g1_i4.p1 TRINITY_DN514_c0_g1~~TRINITY_DN514_c0_g1_i4.p1  ORF type:complete len:476 (-),score=56.54 TRINITY_DN514_c0_g1_i4:286-1713(-)
MQLLVRTLHGKTIPVVCSPYETISQLKSRAVHCRLGIDMMPRVLVLHAGCSLQDNATISSCNLSSGETLSLALPLIGGGGDGGATGAESRDCYLSMYLEKKPAKVNPYEVNLARWVQCSISEEALTQPCAMDMLGNLFNKEALIRAIVTKTIPSRFSHIRGLKDIVTIHLTESTGEGQIIVDDDVSKGRFHCPITGLEMNGRFRFCALRSCGHVLSVRALKEVATPVCLVCHKQYTEEDKIPVNGSQEEVEILRKRMEEGASKAAKVKKDKKKEQQSASAIATSVLTDSQQDAILDSIRANSEPAAGVVLAPTADPAVGKVFPHTTIGEELCPALVEGTAAVLRSDTSGSGMLHQVDLPTSAKRKASPSGEEVEPSSSVGQQHLSANSSARGSSTKGSNKGATSVGARLGLRVEAANGSSRPKGSDRVVERKRYKAGEHAPAGANVSVYSSIFNSSRKEGLHETYTCRNLPLGRN